MSNFSTSQIPNLSGKVAIVTGANSGLGYQTVLELARKGAEVVLASRSKSKADTAAAQIKKELPTVRLHVLPLDLADLKSVSGFANAFKLRFDRLDMLVNNAGVMATPYKETTDGFEMQIGTNHFGHFALTGQLLDLLLGTADARVVNVSSLLYESGDGKINLDDINMRENYDAWTQYGVSKAANILFTFEMHRRLSAMGADVRAIVTHPGFSATNLQSTHVNHQGGAIAAAITRQAVKLVAMNVRQGVLSQLYAATMPDANGGEFWGPTNFGGYRGYPERIDPLPFVKDEVTAKRLWEISEEATGVRYTALEREMA